MPKAHASAQNDDGTGSSSGGSGGGGSGGGKSMKQYTCSVCHGEFKAFQYAKHVSYSCG